MTGVELCWLLFSKEDSFVRLCDKYWEQCFTVFLLSPVCLFRIVTKATNAKVSVNIFCKTCYCRCKIFAVFWDQWKAHTVATLKSGILYLRYIFFQTDCKVFSNTREDWQKSSAWFTGGKRWCTFFAQETSDRWFLLSNITFDFWSTIWKCLHVNDEKMNTACTFWSTIYTHLIYQLMSKHSRWHNLRLQMCEWNHINWSFLTVKVSRVNLPAWCINDGN